jgi:hypothetical protein
MNKQNYVLRKGHNRDYGYGSAAQLFSSERGERLTFLSCFLLLSPLQRVPTDCIALGVTPARQKWATSIMQSEIVIKELFCEANHCEAATLTYYILHPTTKNSSSSLNLGIAAAAVYIAPPKAAALLSCEVC